MRLEIFQNNNKNNEYKRVFSIPTKNFSITQEKILFILHGAFECFKDNENVISGKNEFYEIIHSGFISSHIDVSHNETKVNLESINKIKKYKFPKKQDACTGIYDS